MRKLFLVLLFVAGCFPAYGQHVFVNQIGVHNTITIPSSVVASLPACNAGANGLVRIVTNALTPSVGSTVAGGGAVNVLVRCNGTNWIVG